MILNFGVCVGVMWEYLLGVFNVLSVYIMGIIILRFMFIVTSDLKNNSANIAEQTHINLNHVAEAIVGLSELLEEADQVIEDISRVPSVGDILQQAVQGFIMQKVGPMLPHTLQEPTQEFITSNLNGLVHGETQSESKKETIQE